MPDHLGIVVAVKGLIDMATLEAQTTKNTPVGVIYPAEKPEDPTITVRCRFGKTTIFAAYSDDMLPHLVQFQSGKSIVMFMLRDLLQPSYWRRIRNAYDFFGQLDIDKGVKLGRAETERVVQWLAEYSQALGASVRD